jgi:hypothetical protein
VGCRQAAASGDIVKKLLYQFDTDALPSVFDNVVGYDGGADHITAYGGVTPQNVGGLVEGAIFTRSPKDKKNTAIFVGGGNLPAGEALLAAIQAKFFAKFRVSVMFDSNGSNTTAAAAVAWLAHNRSLEGKRAVVLAGTGPVGQRAAVLLAREGARVAVTGRKLSVVQTACDSLKTRFGADIEAIEAPGNEERGRALEGAHIVLATGAAGITLLTASQWQQHPTLELIADANASPPAGIEGIGMSDRGVASHGKTVFGPLGFGALKLAVHRACIARLFEQNNLLLDAAEIYAVAKSMVGT